MGVIEITQADREAAADLAAQSTKYSFEWREVGAIRHGKHDDWECVQAFARHREAAQREALESAHFIAEQLGEMGTAKCLRLMIDEKASA